MPVPQAAIAASGGTRAGENSERVHGVLSEGAGTRRVSLAAFCRGILSLPLLCVPRSRRRVLPDAVQGALAETEEGIEDTQHHLQSKATLRERVWYAMEESTLINTSVLIVIVFSTTTFVLESEYDDGEHEVVFFWCEAAAVGIFAVEYSLRGWSTPNRMRFVVTPLNVIDLLAILPFAITLLVAFGQQRPPWEAGAAAQLGTLFRVVRLVRVFRVFKLSRYSVGLQLFYDALHRSAMSLMILLFLMLIATILFSSMMYLAEAEFEEDDVCRDSPLGYTKPRLCCAMLCYAVLCCAMLCYAMQVRGGLQVPLDPHHLLVHDRHADHCRLRRRGARQGAGQDGGVVHAAGGHHHPGAAHLGPRQQLHQVDATVRG